HAHRHQHRSDHEVDDQKRQEQQKADLEGALELRDHEGRNKDAHRSSGFCGAFSPDKSTNNRRSFSRTFFSMNPRSGPAARSNASFTLISLATTGFMPTS